MRERLGLHRRSAAGRASDFSKRQPERRDGEPLRVHRNSRGLPRAPRRRNPDAPRRRRPAAVLRRVGERRGADAAAGRGRAAPRTHRSSRTRAAASCRMRRRASAGAAATRTSRRGACSSACARGASPPRRRRTRSRAASRSRARATPPRSSARRRGGGARPTGGRRSRGGCARCRGGSRRRARRRSCATRSRRRARPNTCADAAVPGHGRARRRGAGRGPPRRHAAVGRDLRPLPPRRGEGRPRRLRRQVLPERGAQPHLRGGVLRVRRRRRRHAGGVAPDEGEKGERQQPLPARELKQRLKTAISSSATTGRRRARGSAGRRRTSSDLARDRRTPRGGRCPRRWPRRDKASAARCSSATGGGSRALRGSDRERSYD